MRSPMTLGQWKRSLGEALSLPDAAQAVGRSAVDLARAAARGALRVHRFDAADGRTFFMVRVDDLLDYHRRAQVPRLTAAGMRRALSRMMADAA